MMAKMIQGWEIHNSDTMDAFGARVSHGPAQPFDGRQAKGRVTQMAQRFEVINAQGQRVPFELDTPGHQAFAAGLDEAIHGIMKERGINYLDAFEALAKERPELF